MKTRLSGLILRAGVGLTMIHLLTSVATSQAATVDYYSWRFTSTTNNRAITIKLRSDLLSIGTNFVFGVPLTLQPTNGHSRFSLQPAGYALIIDQVSGAFPFDVPDSTNTYNLIDLVNRGIYVYYPGTSNVVGFASVAGAEMGITTAKGGDTDRVVWGARF